MTNFNSPEIDKSQFIVYRPGYDEVQNMPRIIRAGNMFVHETRGTVIGSAVTAYQLGAEIPQITTEFGALSIVNGINDAIKWTLDFGLDNDMASYWASILSISSIDYECASDALRYWDFDISLANLNSGSRPVFCHSNRHSEILLQAHRDVNESNIDTVVLGFGHIPTLGIYANP
jgi:hypothetical protein